jgi:hypothetical protein
MKLMQVVSKIDLKEAMRYNDFTVSMANYIHLLDTFLQLKMLIKVNTHTCYTSFNIADNADADSENLNYFSSISTDWRELLY